MLVVFPGVAFGLTWVLAPEPKYESSWTVNIFFDNPELTNDPRYIDFVFLDDLHLLMRTGALGDVMYLRLPEEARAELSREQFGDMISSSRKAHFVEITVAGQSPDRVADVVEVIQQNLEEVANVYLVPADYRYGPATINILDPAGEPTLNTSQRVRLVAAVTLATFLVSLAATGVAEWLRMSYQAKYETK